MAADVPASKVSLPASARCADPCDDLGPVGPQAPAIVNKIAGWGGRVHPFTVNSLTTSCRASFRVATTSGSGSPHSF